MLRFCQIAALTALVGVVSVERANAQATDSLLPRGGTWGVEASAFSSGGELLRFSSPHSAWLLGLSASTGHTNIPGSTFSSGGSGSSSYLQLQLGHRWYVPTAPGDEPHLRTTYGLGVVSSLNRSTSTLAQESRQWNGGAYGELGLTWFFTRHLSLGTVGMLTAAMGRDRTESVGLTVNGSDVHQVSTSSDWTISANLVRLMAAVYF